MNYNKYQSNEWVNIQIEMDEDKNSGSIMDEFKTVKHTNGYPIYSRLKQETKDRIEKRWVVPTDEPYLYIDKYERPFVQRPNDFITLCTVRKETLIDKGFHL